MHPVLGTLLREDLDVQQRWRNGRGRGAGQRSRRQWTGPAVGRSSRPRVDRRRRMDGVGTPETRRTGQGAARLHGQSASGPCRALRRLSEQSRGLAQGASLRGLSARDLQRVELGPCRIEPVPKASPIEGRILMRGVVFTGNRKLVPFACPVHCALPSCAAGTTAPDGRSAPEQRIPAFLETL